MSWARGGSWRRSARSGGRWGALALVLAAAAVARATDDAPGEPAQTAVHEYVPSLELAARASAMGVPTETIEVAAARARPVDGDTVVMLVALDEGEAQTQWLVRLRGPLSAEAAETGAPRREAVMYAPDGRAIRFPAKPETYAVLALGPWHREEPAGTILEREARVVMNAGFLDAPMIEAAAFMFRAGRARKEGRLGPDEWLTLSPQPPKRVDRESRARFVTEAGLSDERERAVAASVPMLAEFSRIIAATPGLREVLFAVVRKPTIWSLVSRMGRIDSSFQFHSGDVVPSMGAPTGFAGIGRSYVVPFTFSLNGRAALDCTTLVAEPRPPLRMCGGIVALVAESPERPDARLIVRVIATRTGSLAH